MRYILIVEDDANVAPLEIALTTLSEITVKVFSDGRAALDFLSENGHSLAALVTDLNLPYLDGFELVSVLRSNSRYAGVPILVISGNTHPDVPKRALALGADAFFPKPYSPSEIRHTIARLMHASPTNHLPFVP